MKRSSLAGLCLLMGLLSTTTGTGQSTDAYHAIQIFPVVVDTASFAQRFNITNPNSSALVLTPRYFPGQGTAQAGTPLTCPDIAVPANSAVTITSLRTMCPALVAGSAFGFLHLSETSSAHLPFAAFSRVSNPQGNGFSVEAFPAHTFTSSETVVNGVRRLAATGGSPAFQSNCFMGVVNELAAPGAASPQTVTYKVYNSAGTLLGQSSVMLPPGSYLRLLDVFSTAGAAAGDYNDASVRFSTSAGTSLLSFCTVQDNTSFGADFRIGKQALGAGSQYPSIGAMDDHVSRDSTLTSDIYTNYDGEAKLFSLKDGASRNFHVLYFRHPDWVSCELIDPGTGLRALEAYGLELRLADASGSLLAGGPLVAGFDGLYLGDKRARNASANTRYTLEVRGNGANFANRRYNLHCRSGSGHTMGDMIRSAVPIPQDAEVEPNDSTATATTNTARFNSVPLLTASIGSNTDIDLLRGDLLSAPAIYRFETFIPASGFDCTGNSTTTVRVLDSVGTQIVSDTAGSGISGCGAIVFPFESTGSYYVQVEESGLNATIPTYTLESRKITDKGGESETPGTSGANDTAGTASTLFGSALEGFVSGDHMLEADNDYYAIVVPAGKSVRAEVIEGSRATETCESNGIDSQLYLYASDGTTQLVSNDDSGRGFCSLIDGTGVTSSNPGAKNLSGTDQTWYLRVSKSSLTTGAAAQFTYRLVVTIR